MATIKENINKVKELFDLNDYMDKLITDPDIDNFYSEVMDVPTFDYIIETVYFGAVEKVLKMVSDGTLKIDENHELITDKKLLIRLSDLINELDIEMVKARYSACNASELIEECDKNDLQTKINYLLGNEKRISTTLYITLDYLNIMNDKIKLLDSIVTDAFDCIDNAESNDYQEKLTELVNSFDTDRQKEMWSYIYRFMKAKIHTI